MVALSGVEARPIRCLQRGPMTVLAIDTATPFPAVALLADGGEWFERFPSDRRISERLIPSIRDLLSRGHRRLSDVERVVVLSGPGSFTGIRIGLATAWAFSHSCGIGVESMTTLEALAECLRGKAEQVAVAMDAGRGDCWTATYDLDGERAHVLAPPRLVAAAEHRSDRPTIPVLRIPPDVPPELPAVAAARAASRRPNRDRNDLAPVYLRLAAAEERRGTSAS
jgi:tRNA threonylcarbamoyladenosine biosynthesis protein TsaB